MTRSEGTLDRILDRTIVPGYSSIGYHLRRRSWGADPKPESMAGRHALVTGAGGGLGEATARDLVALGARVHVLGRSLDRIKPTADQLNDEAARHGWSGIAVAEACDVSDLDDVRRFASALRERLADEGAQLDVLVHNAGTMPAERTESADGHELTVATHVLGPILMTELLLPVLGSGDQPGRVVFVASGGMYAQALPVRDPDFHRGSYGGATAYARSKRMQVELTSLLSERWPDLVVATMHPGWADTPGVQTSMPRFRAITKPLLRDAHAGADTIVWLAATEPAPASGLFWHDRVSRPTSYRKKTDPSEEQRARLWAWVQEAVPELS